MSFTKDTGRVLWMKVGEWVASEHAKKQEFRDKFAENYDKAKALEQAKVQGAKRAGTCHRFRGASCCCEAAFPRSASGAKQGC